MIERITIEQLYGIYDYDIQINKDQPVTIITSPNGYGKTTILKIISHLFACDFWYFSLLKFASINIYFRNGKQIVVRKGSKTLPDNEREDLFSTAKEYVKFSFKDSQGKDIETFEINETDILRWERKSLRSSINFRIGEKEFIDEEELYSEYFNEINDTILSEKSKNIRMFMQEFRCSFIKEQRLITPIIVQENRRRFRNLPAIENIAIELQETFSKAQQAFAMASQEIDATFIERLVKEEYQQLSKEDFQKKIESLRTKMNNFRKYGLFSASDRYIRGVFIRISKSSISLYR